MRGVILVLPLLLLLESAASANAVRFLGSHPIPNPAGGGYCYVEVSHIHHYRPTPEFLFQEVDQQHVFTADPSPFSYDGERHAFYGHHPITTNDGAALVYCFLDGPHYHPFAPPNEPDFVVKNGVTFYVGLFAPYFFQLKARVGRAVNEFYQPHARLRPSIDVSPPPEWRDDLRLPIVTPEMRGSSEHKRLVRFNRDARTH
jgi:hypothetical protein